MDRSPDPPEPSGGVLMGHTLGFLRDPLESYRRWARTDDVVAVRVAGRRFCLVSHPDPIHRILVADRDSFRRGDPVRGKLGGALGGEFADADDRPVPRRHDALKPAFFSEKIDDYGPVTTRYAADAVDSWPSWRRFPVDDRLADLTLSVLAKALFGLEFPDGDSPLHDAVEAASGQSDSRTVSTYLPEWVPAPSEWRYRRRLGALSGQIADLDPPTGGEDLFSRLLSLGLPRDAVRDELAAMLLAGYESTAAALSFLVGILSIRPALQDRIVEELDDVVGDRRPEPGDLPDLPTLTATTKETLRLYPPQYALYREAGEPVTLDGVEVGEGTTLVMPPWVVHRDPRFWDDPETFQPRRWRREDGRLAESPSEVGRPECSYFPFGRGPRRCLGAGLARQTVRLVVAVACRRRRFEGDVPPTPTPGATLRPADGVELYAHRR